MPYKTKFSMIYINKLKDYSIRNIYSVAPDVMPFRMKFFCSQGWMEMIVFEKISLFCGFFLNRYRKAFEKFIKCLKILWGRTKVSG